MEHGQQVVAVRVDEIRKALPYLKRGISRKPGEPTSRGGELTTSFWHVRADFPTAIPSQIVEHFWVDDELNPQRSLSTYGDELALVDRGLSLYMEPIQAALLGRAQLVNNVRLGAAIAMLEHAFNTFLGWRHLLTHGYLAEARLFSRSVYEALSRSLAFVSDESLAKKFYDGRQINPTEIQKAASTAVTDKEEDQREALNSLSNRYQRLSRAAHPTLHSFLMRSAGQEPGIPGLRQSVPEDVAFGGLLSDVLGRIAWLGFARDIAYALASVGFVITERSGGWNQEQQEYRAKVEGLIVGHERLMDELYPWSK